MAQLSSGLARSDRGPVRMEVRPPNSCSGCGLRVLLRVFGLQGTPGDHRPDRSMLCDPITGEERDARGTRDGRCGARWLAWRSRYSNVLDLEGAAHCVAVEQVASCQR